MKAGFHYRLRKAVEAFGGEGTGAGSGIRKLRRALREDPAIHRQHTTFQNIGRWIDGKGNPPDYWIAAAANIMGVEYRWLVAGDGPSRRSGPQIKEKAEEGPPEATGDTEGQEGTQEPAEKVEGQGEATEDAEEDDEEEVLVLPKDDDVWDPNVSVMISYVEQQDSIELLQGVKKIETRNPNYRGGRITVLGAIDSRIEELERLP